MYLAMCIYLSLARAVRPGFVDARKEIITSCQGRDCFVFWRNMEETAFPVEPNSRRWRDVGALDGPWSGTVRLAVRSVRPGSERALAQPRLNPGHLPIFRERPFACSDSDIVSAQSPIPPHSSHASTVEHLVGLPSPFDTDPGRRPRSAVLAGCADEGTGRQHHITPPPEQRWRPAAVHAAREPIRERARRLLRQ